ncbi:MAG: hypothetical protein LZF60_180019 [Nitrospira sp.]|nr:MAG: hypothetical protein LZF60_180019 [Nitrospira sp.]
MNPRHSGPQAERIRRRNRYGNEAGIESAPKGLHEFKPRRIHEQKSRAWRKPGLQIAGDRTSARHQVSIRQGAVGGQAFTKIDVGRLVRLMLSPPTQHIENGVAGWNGDRWMSDHRMLNPSRLRRRTQNAAVDLFGFPLENPKSDGGFHPAVLYEVSLWPPGGITKWNHVSLRSTVSRRGARNSTQPHDFI